MYGLCRVLRFGRPVPKLRLLEHRLIAQLIDRLRSRREG